MRSGRPGARLASVFARGRPRRGGGICTGMRPEVAGATSRAACCARAARRAVPVGSRAVRDCGRAERVRRACLDHDHIAEPRREREPAVCAERGLAITRVGRRQLRRRGRSRCAAGRCLERRCVDGLDSSRRRGRHLSSARRRSDLTRRRRGRGHYRRGGWLEAAARAALGRFHLGRRQPSGRPGRPPSARRRGRVGKRRRRGRLDDERRRHLTPRPALERNRLDGHAPGCRRRRPRAERPDGRLWLRPRRRGDDDDRSRWQAGARAALERDELDGDASRLGAGRPRAARGRCRRRR